MNASDLTVKIFADGADLDALTALASDPLIQGFTTNPTLMRRSGVEDYERFGLAVLDVIGGRPISFEVFADDDETIERQARKLASWGENVYVKIPITNTLGEPTTELTRRLSEDGIRLNVTAILTNEQILRTIPALESGPASYVSMFAGRIADTGIDPIPMMKDALDSLAGHPHIELIWASPRELLNIVQADQIGCHVITVTHDLLAKLPGLGRDLTDLSLATVQMFHDDARASGFEL